MAKRISGKPGRLGLWTVAVAKILSLVAIIALGIMALYQGRDTLRQSSFFDLQVIEYYGARNFNKKAFNVILLRSFDRNLLMMDLTRVRALLESESWVATATIRRKLPDRLLIYLREREPIAVAAIDDELYVVDCEGVVLDNYGPHYQHIDQPIVKGLKNIARENALAENAQRIKVYLDLISDLEDSVRDYTGTISEVDVTNPNRVAVVPIEDPVAVYLGKSSFRKRYEVFLSQKDLYYRLKKKYGLIEYVDVTYDNKIIFHTPEEAVAG